MNTTQFQNITTIYNVAEYANTGTGGILFIGGVIVFYIILIAGLTKFTDDILASLAVSSWAMLIISALLWYAELLPPALPLFFIFMAAISTLILYASSR